MRIRKAFVAVAMGLTLAGTAACGAQNGCFDDGEQVSCNDNDDDDDEGDDD